MVAWADYAGGAASGRVGRDGDRIVVWLWGEHDVTTQVLLSRALAGAIDGTDGDVVVDLTEVPYMAAATIHPLLRFRALLAGRGRRLTVRSPQSSPRRLLEVCDLTELIEPAPPDRGVERPGVSTTLEAGLVVDGDFGGVSGAMATVRFLELPARQQPTAVVFANDLMAVAGVPAALRRGAPRARRPFRRSVRRHHCRRVHAPALTTVARDTVAWGRAATRAVFDLVEHGADDDVELAPARLVFKESTPERLTVGSRVRRSQPSTRSRPTRRTS